MLDISSAPDPFTVTLEPSSTFAPSLYQTMVGCGVPRARQFIAEDVPGSAMTSKGWAVNCGEVPNSEREGGAHQEKRHAVNREKSATHLILAYHIKNKWPVHITILHADAMKTQIYLVTYCSCRCWKASLLYAEQTHPVITLHSLTTRVRCAELVQQKYLEKDECSEQIHFDWKHSISGQR